MTEDEQKEYERVTAQRDFLQTEYLACKGLMQGYRDMIESEKQWRDVTKKKAEERQCEISASWQREVTRLERELKQAEWKATKTGAWLFVLMFVAFVVLLMSFNYGCPFIIKWNPSGL